MKTLLLMLCVLFSWTSFANGNNLQLQFNQDDLSLKYGEYSEVEFYVDSNQQVDFEITSETKPVGLNLVPLENNSFILAGSPEFLGKFCILIQSSLSEDQVEVERVCLVSESNERIDHPEFKTERHLKSFQKNSYAQTSIELEGFDSNVELEFVQGELPEGLEVSGNGSLSINGTPSYVGVYEILVLAKKLTDYSEVYVYKQFQIEVREEIVDRYQCDIGYYYDETLGYCVQNSGTYCEDGTFWDPEVSSCVRYTRPAHTTCRPGSYYDHFLYRCVRNTYRRCPYNYEFDSYYNRCVRSPYTCSIGYRYDYAYRTCVYVGVNQCRRGTHYSSYRGRCVPNYSYCRAGQYWDGYTCRFNTRQCRRGSYWDPHWRSCRTRTTYSSCRGGYRYDYGQLRCVRRSVYAGRTCRNGRYSPRAGRCVTYRPNRPNRPVVRPRPNRPVVVRPNRPPHRPNRPTTRPNRPNRPNRPTTRPDRPNRPNRPTTRPDRPNRPNRPTTRPDRPNRPNRPTTRPDRPNRPNRPTTRPDRPSRPTTRPDRPSRPNRPNRPTTRPNRPSRDSGSSTRPSRPNRGSGSSARPSRPNRNPSNNGNGNGRRNGRRGRRS